MKKSIVFRGRLSGSRHIDLEKPVTGVEVEVEVVLRPVPVKPEKPKESILDFTARMPGGHAQKRILTGRSERNGIAAVGHKTGIP